MLQYKSNKKFRIKKIIYKIMITNFNIFEAIHYFPKVGDYILLYNNSDIGKVILRNTIFRIRYDKGTRNKCVIL